MCGLEAKDSGSSDAAHDGHPALHHGDGFRRYRDVRAL